MPGMERERRSAADVIVVDPPKKGCHGVLLDTIRHMPPERVVYVSCDPRTLPTDVRLLGEFGSEVRKGISLHMTIRGTMRQASEFVAPFPPSPQHNATFT